MLIDTTCQEIVEGGDYESIQTLQKIVEALSNAALQGVDIWITMADFQTEEVCFTEKKVEHVREIVETC